jgi:hypothetical protein
MDNDDLVREHARATLDILWDKYWQAKKADSPPTAHDDYYDLRVAYEKAAAEYAALEGRLLRDDILSKDVDVDRFRRIRADMEAAVRAKETVMAALNFVQLIVKLA